MDDDRPRFPLDSPAYDSLEDEDDEETEEQPGWISESEESDGVNPDEFDFETSVDVGESEKSESVHPSLEDISNEDESERSLKQRILVWLATRLFMLLILGSILYFMFQSFAAII